MCPWCEIAFGMEGLSDSRTAYAMIVRDRGDQPMETWGRYEQATPMVSAARQVHDLDMTTVQSGGNSPLFVGVIARGKGRRGSLIHEPVDGVRSEPEA